MLSVEAALHGGSVTAGGKDVTDKKLIRQERLLMAAWNVLLLLKILTLTISAYPPPICL